MKKYYVYTFEDKTIIKSSSALSVMELIPLVDSHGNVKLDIVEEEKYNV